MAAQPAQPTILVKKSDGTFVRMTLAEAKKMSAQGKAQPPASVPTIPAVSPPAPTKPTAPRPAMTKTDFSSPLEEKIVGGNAPVVSAPRSSQVADVLKKLNFRAPEAIEHRLRSAIQLRLKEIRGQSETEEMAMRPPKNGGLGLTREQASELEKACSAVLKVQTQKSQAELAPAIKPAPLANKSVSAPSPAKNLPMVEPPELPAVASPHNTFVHGEIKPRPVFSEPPVAPKKETVVSPPLNKNFQPPSLSPAPRPAVAAPANFRPSPPSTSKKVMQDVTSNRAEMGPVDEIRFFSLTDFRRLSANPVEAASRLRQKFTNLKDESILLYLEALNAWRESPLYLEYLKSVGESLSKKQKLSVTVLSDKNRIQPPEIAAIVNMNQSL